MKPWLTRAQHWLYAHRFRSTANLTLPHFLGIGAQKSGTTWLHANLRLHPDVYLAPEKELHYFDWNFDKPLATYAQNFTPAGPKLRGEITPAYSILPISRIRFIHTIMPRVRLIFLMRNPIDRAWSHALMSLVIHAKRDYATIPRKEFIQHFQSDASTQRGDYDTVIQNWTSIFDPTQLFLGYFEDISLRPIDLLRDICRHLGLRDDVDWKYYPTREKVLPGVGIEMPPEYRKILNGLYTPPLKKLHSRLGPRITPWIPFPV